MADPAKTYLQATDGPLRQGEVITGLVEPRVVIEAVPVLFGDSGDIQVDVRRHPIAAVMTQDCDLEGDFRARSEEPPNEKKMLPSVLLCEVHELEALRPNVMLLGINAKRWKLLRQNHEPRFHHLQAVPQELDREAEGLPAMGLDFNRFFTLPTGLVYAQLKDGARRRFRMHSPYFEHVTTRFFAYQSRIAVPEQHEVEDD